MNTDKFIQERVKNYYWNDDINCATASLKILSEKFNTPISDQIVDAALGMHGAGGYGAQCGLVEGTLMFIGILGRNLNIPDDEIVAFCSEFARQFENRFKSLLCSILRPESFALENPPHLCEEFTCETIEFSIDFISRLSKNCNV